jgi:hypothetical protein
MPFEPPVTIATAPGNAIGGAAPCDTKSLPGADELTLSAVFGCCDAAYRLVLVIDTIGRDSAFQLTICVSNENVRYEFGGIAGRMRPPVQTGPGEARGERASARWSN